MATNQQVLDELEQLKLDFVAYKTREDGMVSKLDAMYRVLVTGNGCPPLPEIVRTNEKWIKAQADEQCERAKEVRAFQRSLALLALGQVITVLVAVFIK